MTPVAPKRPRSPGRRSFSPGTDADWEQALQSPHVQAMLRDPAIVQAAMSQGAQQPQRFAGGGQQTGGNNWDGLSESTLIRMRGDPMTPPQEQQEIDAALQRKRSGISAPPSLGTAGTGGIPGVASADSMAGLKNLQNAGPATALNTALPAAAAGLIGLGGSYGKANIGAGLVGAGVAALGNYLLRRKTQPPGSTAGPQTPGSESLARAQTDTSSGNTTAPTSLPDLTGSGAGSLRMGQDKDAKNIHQLGDGQWVNDQTGAPATPVSQAYIGGSPASIGAMPGGLDPSLSEIGAYGSQDMDPSLAEIGAYARGGEVHSDAAEDRKQTIGILKEKKLLKARGGRAFAEGGDLSPPVPKKGKAILLRKPMEHAPIPVLHTTIVITGKPKKSVPKKKRKGGTIKAAALPPKKGPGNGDDGPPAPYRKGGHVQVPRGTGAAIRGKRFGGIY